MLLQGRKKKDLLTVLSELTGPEKKRTDYRRDEQGVKTETSTVQIRDVRIVVEIGKIDELIAEIRELKETIREFVNLIKSRIEQQEINEENSGSEEKTNAESTGK